MSDNHANHRRNTIWITDGNVNKVISINDLIPSKWKRGKTQKIDVNRISNFRKNTMYINNNIETKVISIHDELPDGWEYGRLMKFKITNGIKNMTVTRDELQSYLKNGWFRGWLD